MKKVLFSCLGSTDPVRGLRDGAMLHIVRNYLPDKIIWFISKEMKEKDKIDHRYDLAMQKFCVKHPDYHPKIERIESEIEDVSEFDVFYDPFEEIVSKISEENPGAEILLNLSSGTIQMKMTMAMLAMDLRYRTKGIQVKSPEKRASTAQRTTDQNYDAITEIELNEDDEPGAENRCSEPKLFLIRRQAERERIETMLRTYNYGALSVMRGSFPPSCRALITHLARRAEYNTAEAEKYAKKLNGRLPFGLYPMKPAKHEAEARIYRKITEYYLCLKLLQKSGQLTSLIVRLNPLIVSIQEAFLKEKCEFRVTDISEKVGKKIYISRRRVHEYSVDLEQYLDHELDIMREKSYPSIHVYNSLIRYCSEGDTEELRLFEMLELLNETERNQMAHNLDNVTEDSFRNCVGCTSGELLKKLEELLQEIFSDICNPKIFSIYDRCNEFIIQQL